MNAIHLLAGPVAQALGWALLHLLWQAPIVAGILGATLALLPRRSANARYLASISALAIVFVFFIATAARAYDPAAGAVPASPSPAQVVSLQTESVPELIAAIAAEDWRERLVPVVTAAQQWLPSIVAVWLAGVVLLSARLLLSWTRARSLVSHDTVPASDHWQRVAAHLSDALGLSRAVRLLESAAIEVPTVIGTLRPAVLLPASTLTGLTPDQIEMVLAHELAHIRRHDFFVNLLQAFAETILFYHPAVWWISRRVRVERENCCDDMAVAVCGNPLQYARALARLEELRDSGLAVAIAANGGSLLDRVRRLAADRAESTGISPRWAAAVATLSIVIVALALPSLPALAQRDAAQHETAPAATTIDVVEAPEPPESPARVAMTNDDDDDTDIDLDIDPDLDLDLDVPATPVPPGTPVADLMDLDVDLDVDIPVAAMAPMPPSPMMAVPAIPHVAATPHATPAPHIAPTPRVPSVPSSMAAPRARPGMPVPPVPAVAPMALVENFRHDSDREEEDDRVIGSTGKLTVDELVALRATGVTPEYVNAMRQIFPRLTVRGVTSMSAVQVTPEFVREMRDAGLALESAREATTLKALNISAAFVREMRNAGFETTSPRELASLKAVNVCGEWLQGLRAAGVKIDTARDAMTLKAVGVTPDFVKRLAAAGYTDLTARQLARLAAAGIDETFIRSIQQDRGKH